ncbi:hypothetical protein NVR04_09095 [Staphylococcus pseudintermedius]|uniref:hypothetical protein n=1 Tax=Staphylococcus pseudintermedius TaxID=283734 RepID=UPI001A081719|nr:hypothetical protein [Staphylococcus pseudintermedius]EGQ0364154.1 hypothetical protein [Staphylococcus pseudintermedius]EGQ2806126.1 hypothetical protein [Staphylococcus pseudintermedius]EGQ3109500.1 hypothetical protein [Staphylococcus pseudintermedius]EGQ3567261.1 hypothetical protein [Staphylococcus pseudintermedius]EGQ3785337.1 hypothetical protein [Staphylococcus pseudintermedius]
MMLTITTVNNKTYYAFYSTQYEYIVLNDLNNKKFIKVIDSNGHKNFLQTSVIENVEVDASKDALDNFKKVTDK